MNPVPALADALAVVRSMVGGGTDMDPGVGVVSQRVRVEVIGLLEDLKDAASAVQAELAVAVVAHEIAAAEAASDDVTDDVDGDVVCVSRARVRRVARARRSAVAQVALARRESPHAGGVFVGVAEALVGEMPCTFAALRAGALNEFRARVLVRETACLSRQDRTAVDKAVCGDPRSLVGVGTKRLAGLVKRESYALDPHAVVRRSERDAAERCVTLRPAPGSMTYLTALVPLVQGVAVLANLQQAAQAVRAAGDERSKGQVMADTLVERLTGQASAQAVPVMVNLVVSDTTLLASGHEPGVVDGAHPVPAQLARDLVARAMTLPDTSSPGTGDAGATGVNDVGEDPGGAGDRCREADKVGAWVRRLYADAGGNLIAMDSRARTFPTGLAALLRVRDQGLCRTPWCDAPIAHLDHVTPAADGGPTSATNGQGLCAGCNYTKQAPGWTQHVENAHADAAGRSGTGRSGTGASGTVPHTVRTITPTGHEYTSVAPAAPTPIRLGGALEHAATPDGPGEHQTFDEREIVDERDTFDQMVASIGSLDIDWGTTHESPLEAMIALHL